MKKIWKFPIYDLDVNLISMPVGAEILDIGVQHGKIQIWAVCNDDADMEERTFSIYGTGMMIDTEGKKHLKTIQAQGGNFIWHIFEVLK